MHEESDVVEEFIDIIPCRDCFSAYSFSFKVKVKLLIVDMLIDYSHICQRVLKRMCNPRDDSTSLLILQNLQNLSH